MYENNYIPFCTHIVLVISRIIVKYSLMKVQISLGMIVVNDNIQFYAISQYIKQSNYYQRLNSMTNKTNLT